MWKWIFNPGDFGFGRFMFNSLVITIAITVGSLLIASLAAYVITKHRVPGRRLIFLLIVASMMVPWRTTLVPNYARTDGPGARSISAR